MRLRRHRLELSIAIAAIALVAALPVGAQAAGGGSIPGETATESPGSTTEPTTPPASTGWSPTGTTTGASGDGTTSIRRGSSLGSGGSSKETGVTSEEKAGTTSDESLNTTGSGSYHEPESSTASAPEGSASTPPPVRSTPHPAAHPAPAPPPTSTEKAVSTAVGTATPVALPETPKAETASSAPQAEPAPLVDSHDQATSGLGSLSSLAVVVLGLVLVIAGGLGLNRWRRRGERKRLEVLSRREAEWEATLQQIQMKRASGVTTANGEQRIEVESDFAPLKVQTGMAASSRAS